MALRSLHRLLGRTVLVALISLLSRSARSQLAQGFEFGVNTYTTSDQIIPSVASSPAGDFVVVWASKNQDAPGYAVIGQRFASSGDFLGGEFRVNTYTTNVQGGPSVAADGTGRFVVVWASKDQDAPGYGVFGQRYTSAGAPLGGEFRVNTYTTNAQFAPSISSDSAGDFVVVWTSQNQDGDSYGVFGQRFASSGAPVGPEFRVNSVTTELQLSNVVGSAPNGDFVVAWESYLEDGDNAGIFAQRFASSGAALGVEFQVNSHTTDFQGIPAVSVDASGSFVVVWNGTDQGATAGDVFGQRYSSTGSRRGSEFQVNTYTLDFQILPSVSSDSAGNFVVVWSSFSQDGDNYGIFGQLYASSGVRIGAEFQVNSFTTARQLSSKVSSDSTGRFVVAWHSNLEDFSGFGVFAQRMCFDLLAVSISTMGSLAVCPTGTGGTATVADSGGGVTTHQWIYRTSPMGAPNPILGQTGMSYLVSGADFAGGAPGLYYLGCLTTPSCGTQKFSNDVIVTVSNDTTAPTVTAPPALTITQSLCQ